MITYLLRRESTQACTPAATITTESWRTSILGLICSNKSFLSRTSRIKTRIPTPTGAASKTLSKLWVNKKQVGLLFTAQETSTPTTTEICKSTEKDWLKCLERFSLNDSKCFSTTSRKPSELQRSLQRLKKCPTIISKAKTIVASNL